MPIGNLTSQIFANIYLHELDFFVAHRINSNGYVRYGDDFVLFFVKREQALGVQARVTKFLAENLFLEIHPRNNIVQKSRHGLRFLGSWLHPNGRSLQARTIQRITKRLAMTNAASYRGVVRASGSYKQKKWFEWKLVELIDRIE